MSAIDQLFQKLRASDERAFMPFVTAGDPNLQFTEQLLRTCVAEGAHLCEVGIPYSDPIADGPVIQESYTRALARGTTLAQIFQSIANVSADITQPLVSMVSFGIVRRVGLDKYVQQAGDAGFAGLIVPDLPVEEAHEMAAICQRYDLSLIQLIAPTTTEKRALEIARTSSGFIYFVSVTGITGARQQLPTDIMDRISWLKSKTELPVCVGFGVSQPEQATMLAQVADGIIVGSAIVRLLAADKNQDAILADVAAFVRSMVAALKT